MRWKWGWGGSRCTTRQKSRAVHNKACEGLWISRASTCNGRRARRNVESRRRRSSVNAMEAQRVEFNCIDHYTTTFQQMWREKVKMGVSIKLLHSARQRIRHGWTCQRLAGRLRGGTIRSSIDAYTLVRWMSHTRRTCSSWSCSTSVDFSGIEYFLDMGRCFDFLARTMVPIEDATWICDAPLSIIPSSWCPSSSL